MLAGHARNDLISTTGRIGYRQPARAVAESLAASTPPRNDGAFGESTQLGPHKLKDALNAAWLEASMAVGEQLVEAEQQNFAYAAPQCFHQSCWSVGNY
jgi:hypothetical protein